MALRLFGRSAQSIFAIRGADENSATIALGWVLARSPSFADAFVSDILEARKPLPRDVLIDLQRHEEDGGFTDIEIFAENTAHILVEAKRGWALPTRHQLEKYAGRFDESGSSCRIVSLSAADQHFAGKSLPARVCGVAVVHRSWSDISKLVARALRSSARTDERLWLRELHRHLRGYVSVQKVSDNEVFVVSLSRKRINPKKPFTWVDVVERHRNYFHPIGDRWPSLPVNYIGFRYDGRLQSVHHVDKWEVAADVAKVHPNWPRTDRDHFIYKLGPPMRPSRALPNGKIYGPQHIRCALDTLLSGACRSVKAARDETKRRYRMMEGLT